MPRIARHKWKLVLAGIVIVWPAAVAWPQAGTSSGQFYSKNCAKCHDPHDVPSHAPDRAALAQMTADAIFNSMKSGSMAQYSKELSDSQKQEIAEFISGRTLGSSRSGAASAMPNSCPRSPLGDPFAEPFWNGWGRDLTNARFQPTAAAGITAEQVPKLKLKWAFGFPNATSAWGQATVVGGRIYVGSSNGFVYSLGAKTGCVYWSFEAKGGVRSAITMGPRIEGTNPAQYPLYFGDVKGNVYAVDASNGKLLWTDQADSHPNARITAAPILADGNVYVPVASWEATARGADSVCCKFRGSVVAYDGSTGERLWKSYTIQDEAKPTKKNANGVQEWGPSGGGVWDSPTVDVERKIVYIGTGDSYTTPAVNTVDAVLAIDLKSGKLLWSHQLTKNDVAELGDSPDFDIGASVILRKLRDGRRILLVSQKSGITYALDADHQGKEIWEHRTGAGSRRGGIMWGAAADDNVIYVPNVDTQLGPQQAGGLTALRIDTGAEIWHVKPPVPGCTAKDEACAAGQSAAISLIPGAVFSGSTNGVMRAYSTQDGHVLWEFDTAKEFKTVNGVPGHGGSINGPGPTVARGMLFFSSGYGYGGGKPGNVLLGFEAN